MTSAPGTIYRRPANSTPSAASNLLTTFIVLLVEVVVCLLLFETLWWWLHESADDNDSWASLALHQKLVSRLLWWHELVLKGSWSVLLFVCSILSLRTVNYFNQLVYRAVGLLPDEPPEQILPPREEGD